MTDLSDPVLRLAADLVALDSRSFVSNLAVAELFGKVLAAGAD
jgi:hypothetical protein